MRLNRLFLILLFGACIRLIHAQTLTENIRLNQVGFYTEGSKKAIAIDFTETAFEVWTSDHASKVYTGYLSQRAGWDASCEENIQLADFSNLKKEGSFIVVIGNQKSHPFTISSTVLDTVAKAQMKYYYYNRSGYTLKPEYAGKWAREAGHLNTQVTVLETPTRTVSMHGGWYDAGDYGLYMITGSIAACQLMMAYEQFPQYWNQAEWNIPESNNGVPDILDEIKYELQWMYHMKDTDNGVWFKATSKQFPGFVMPDKEKSTFYCMVKNATSAYDYAATFAFASRIFKNYQVQFPGFSDSCIVAAKEAWTWGLAHEKTNPSCYNPPGVVTGEYGDDVANNNNDNKVLAGVELFLTTNDSLYLKEVITTAQDGFVNGEAICYEKRPLACMQLALHGDALAKSRLLDYANKQIEIQEQHGYIVNLGDTKYDFNWGSNRRIANRGMALMVAYMLTNDRKYLDGVSNAMDYILGRNATGYSFITGFGSKRVQYPHHRISAADTVKDPQPGLPMQGPYYGNMGQCTPNIISTCAAKNYIDNICSYSSNELSVDQGSPNVFNLGGLHYFLSSPVNVEIVEPLNNTVFTKDTLITILASTTNNTGDVEYVDFYINHVLTHTDTLAPYTFQLAGAVSKQYEIKAIAYTANNDSSTSTIHLAVGNVSPKLYITSPLSNQVFNPQSLTPITIKGSAIDVDGSINKVEFYLNNNLVATSTQSSFDFTIPSLTPLLPIGESIIKVIAYDDNQASTTEEVKVFAYCKSILKNGEFNDSSYAWTLTNKQPYKGNMLMDTSTGNTILKVAITTKGARTNVIQLHQTIAVKKGNTYQLTFYAKADTTRTIECLVQHQSEAWDPHVTYTGSVITLQASMQLYSYTFTPQEDDDSCFVRFLLGGSNGASVYFDSVFVSHCEYEDATIHALILSASEVDVSNTYNASYTYANKAGQTIHVYPLPPISWTSSDTSVVTVDSLGKIRAKAIGVAKVSAMLSSNANIIDSMTITVKEIIGIAEQNKLEGFISPTSFTDMVSITANEDLASIEVLSLTGQVLKQFNCDSNKEIINLSDLSSGMYLLKLQALSNQASFYRIVKL